MFTRHRNQNYQSVGANAMNNLSSQKPGGAVRGRTGRRRIFPPRRQPALLLSRA